MNIFNISDQVFQSISSLATRIYKALFISASDLIADYDLPWIIEEILQAVLKLFGDFNLLSLIVSLGVICIILTFVYRFVGRF